MNMKKVAHIFLFFIALIISSCFGETTTVTTMSIIEFDPDKLKKSVLVDVRTPEEFAEGHLPNAINVDVKNENFIEKVSEIKKKEPVYLYCKSGMRSKKAAEILDSLGYKKIFNLDGGFLTWSKANNIVEK